MAVLVRFQHLRKPPAFILRFSRFFRLETALSLYELFAEEPFNQTGKLTGMCRRMLHLFHFIGAEAINASNERNLIIHSGLPV